MKHMKLDKDETIEMIGKSRTGDHHWTKTDQARLIKHAKRELNALNGTKFNSTKYAVLKACIGILRDANVVRDEAKITFTFDIDDDALVDGATS